MKLLFRFILFFVVLLCAQPFFGMEITGNIKNIFSYKNYNSCYGNDTFNPSYNNFFSYLGGNFFLDLKKDDLCSFYFDLQLDGQYQNFIDELSGANLVSPVAANVNQLYVFIKLQDSILLYAGKKSKELGVSSFFNISNIISPKYIRLHDYYSNALGMVELNFLPSDFLNLGTIAYFKETYNWADVNLAAYWDLFLNDINFINYFFIESFNNIFISANLSWQVDAFKFYSEVIYANTPQQKILRNDYSNVVENDFITQPYHHSFSCVAGIAYGDGNNLFQLEYMFRQDGLSLDEQNRFCTYLKGLSISDVEYLTDRYSQFALLKHYLGFGYSRSQFMITELSLNLQFFASLPSIVDNSFFKYSSFQFMGSINYAITQNLKLALDAGIILGGDESEFMNLLDSNYSVSLILQYCF